MALEGFDKSNVFQIVVCFIAYILLIHCSHVGCCIENKKL